MAGRIIDQPMKAIRIEISTSRCAAERARASHNECAAASHKTPDKHAAAVKATPKPAIAFLTTRRLARSFGLRKRSTGARNQAGSWLQSAPGGAARSRAPLTAARGAMG